jgi:hypothetical protein
MTSNYGPLLWLIIAVTLIAPHMHIIIALPLAIIALYISLYYEFIK